MTDDWATISNELLQGLVHAFNNRVAALSASVELAQLGADEEGDPLVDLSAEVARLQRVNALLGLLPERRNDPEALEIAPVLEDAIRLHAHHPRLRAEHCEVVYESSPMPVRAPRWALTRALVMLVHAAKRAGESVQGRGGAPVRVVCDEASVAVRVEVADDPSADLTAMAARCGGSVGRVGDLLEMRLPSLAELRRREREERENEGGPPA